MKINSLLKLARNNRLGLMLLLVAFLVPMSVLGQETVTIGTGTTVTNQNPIGTWYNYSFTEQLYTAAEIGMEGTISSISFNYAVNTANNYPIAVYMKTVANENLSSTIAIADADLVFQGNLSVTGAGWVTINLDTPFEYDGTGNLLIAINKGYVSYFSGDTWYYTSASSMARYAQNDNNAYSPTSSLPSATASSNRPNIKILITQISNPKPKSLMVSNLEGRSATLSWTAPNENVVEYQYQYKAGEGEWTALESTTNTSVNLTNLTTDTDYTFQVKAIYAEEESDYASTSFHTLITCPRPTALQATLTQTDATIATLSWTENGETTNWVLEYGTNDDFSNATIVEVNGTPTIDLTGLTPETLYHARVKADCGDDDQSLWCSVLNFKPTTSITIPIAQEPVVSSYDYPVNMLYNYSLTEQIYDFDKIGYQGTINSVAFYYNRSNSASGFSISGVKLFMKHVTRTAFADDLDMEPLTSADLVWTGTFEAFVDGWVTITLDNPFEYDGESNLLIATLDETVGYPGGNNYFEYSQCEDYKVIQWYGDSTPPDPYNTVLGWSGNKRYEKKRNNIQLNIFPSETPRPVRLAVNNVFGHVATISWETLNENAIGYQYQYKADDRGDWTPLVTTTDLSVSLESLAPETNYLFRVKALYVDDGESEFSTTSFATREACPDPTDLHASLTLGNGTVATLSWTEVGLANEWELEYGMDPNFTGATSATVNDTPSLNLTGLSAETKYYARVKAVCGGDDGESQWSDVLVFTPTFAIPYTVYDGTWPCDNIPMYASYFGRCTKSECIMHADSLVDIDDCLITSLTFYPSYIEKDSWGNSVQQVFLMEVEAPFFDYISWGDTTQVFMGCLQSPSRTDETYTINFTHPYAYHGGHLLIGVYNISDVIGGASNTISWYGIQSNALQGASRYGWAGSMIWVEYTQTNFLPKTTFSYIPNPTARPRNLTASNIAIHSATLSWTAANEDVTGYQYRYMSEGGAWTEWTGTTALSVDLEGLTAEMEYTFQVKALYGEVESNVASITFVPTPLMRLTLYEGATEAGSNIPFYGYYYDQYVKNECLFPNTQLTSMSGATISSISFYSKAIYSGSWEGAQQQVFVKEVDGATLTDFSGAEGATMVFEGHLPTPTAKGVYTIPFSQGFTYHGGNLLIGIYNITPGSDSKQVDWYGVFASQDFVSAYGYDSGSLESVSCIKTKWLPKTTFSYIFYNPWNLQASDITMDGATLSWNASRVDVLGYEYQYRTEDGDWTELATTDNTTVTLTDLTQVTNYTFQVRSVFEEGVYGDFVSVSFQTSQIPVLVDFSHSFVDDFEGDNNWVLLNGSETNQWTIGTATRFHGEKSLYITNDGQNYAYSSTMSHVFATKTFHLVPGSYEVGYYWKNRGCNQDKVNMVVVPESAAFAAGESAIEYIQSDECLVSDSWYSPSSYPSWYTKKKQFEVIEEGLYKVVFYWYNLNSIDYTPPAAIDDFSLKVYLGDAPSNLTTSNITAHAVDLSWIENGTAEAWQVKYYTNEEYSSSGYNVNDENYGHIMDAETNTGFTISGLDPETEYIWFVRSSYTMDDQTGYTNWSSSNYFETAVSCLPVIGLHVAELGMTTATLAWNTDPQQEQENMPAEWNVLYITAPATLYDFESENTTPQYYTYSQSSEWAIEDDAVNAHSTSHYMQSPDCYGYIEFPAYGGGAASFWAKSLVEDENDAVYISIYYDGNSSSGSGGDYKGRGNDKDRNSYMGGYIVTSDTYKKITVDLADYQGEGTLRLQLEGQVALDDITVNMPGMTVTNQTLDFNSGSLGNDVGLDGWSLEYDGDNGYLMSEANYTNNWGGAYADFPIQLGGEVTFRAKALEVTEAVEYTVAIWDWNFDEVITETQISVTDAFVDYEWDLSEYSGMAYLEFLANEQPSLVIDDLTLDMPSMGYTTTTVSDNTLQLNDLQQFAVYTVGVQAHCGEDDDSQMAMPISFVPALCESEDQCQISYEWNTVDGEGWNDAYLKVIHHESGLRVGFAEMDLGTSGSGTFGLCDGETYDLYYYLSGKEYVDFTVYDPAGNVIASYALFQSLTEEDDPYIQFTMDCDVCQWPTHLTATNLTTESATLTWEQGGDVTSWVVSYRDATDFDNENINQSSWTALPQNWTPLTFDEDYNLVETEDWTPDEGALVSNMGSLLFIPVSLGGQAVVTAHGNEDEALGIGIYQGGNPVGMSSDYLPYPPVYELSEDPQQYVVDLSGYQGEGYLFLYHGCGDEPAFLYLDQLVVYGLPEWSEGVVVNTTPTYTIGGLIPGNTYQAKVQAVCGDNEYSNPAMVSFVTPFCNPENQCEISYILRDSYSDSWENAYISVVHHNSDTEVARLTMQYNDGYELVGTLALCKGETYDFMYVYGNCCINEHRFAIYDPSGEVVMDYLNQTPDQEDVVSYTMDCSGEPTTVQLSAGWNWWTPTVETNVLELEDLDELDNIVSESGTSLTGDLELVAGQMYKIKVNADCSLSLDGEPFTTASVTLAPGAHWFGFIGSEMSVADAFADFMPEVGDKVISQNEGFAIYDGQNWVGTLTTLVPGKGYVYVSQASEPKTLYLGQ